MAGALPSIWTASPRIPFAAPRTTWSLSSLLGQNSPYRICAYCASPICLLVECYASSDPVPTQAKCDRNQSDVTLTSPIAGFQSATTPLPGQDELLKQLSHFLVGKVTTVRPHAEILPVLYAEVVSGVDNYLLHLAIALFADGADEIITENLKLELPRSLRRQLSMRPNSRTPTG
ncbi:hypothetical protein HPB51_027880 [Rhipicephalus microplus]|uniref:Uncharacterized protein n=1 Tax=Rhipicephalus microplus TaxID=6941 RepID=A0A9J6CZA7_RHIMP|nr:hypothetical protein HPB51_027880 [Rhipicephalus microplus]